MTNTISERASPLDDLPHPQPPAQQPRRDRRRSPPPESFAERYVGSGKLRGKAAIITGGDSGIGQSTAICFAKEGADVVVAYLDEHEDAEHTRQAVERCGGRCVLIAGDIGEPGFPKQIVERALKEFGRLDIVVNNAAELQPKDRLEQIDRRQLERTFRTNFFGAFELTREALPHLGEGSCIINTTSVTAYRGSAQLLDYAASKGALVSFTRSLAQQLAPRGIRVNAVAPGPVWTPMISTSTSDPQTLARFGQDVPMGRPAQPDEISPCFVFLASADGSYMTGQVLHPNGGEAVNG